MFSSIVWPTLDELFHGSVTFKQVGEIFSTMFSELLGHENFAEIGGVVSILTQRFALPIFTVLAILSLIFAMHGRALLPKAKSIGFFILGFIFGVAYVAPLIFDNSTGVLPPAVGGLIGIIAMFLAKHLYRILYIGAFAYSAYMIFMGGQLLPESIVGFTKENMVMALVAVCITIVLVVLLRKPIETIGTALLGGYLFSLCIDRIICDAFSGKRIAAVSIIIMLAIAVLGAVKQFKAKKSVKTKGNPVAATPAKAPAKVPAKAPAKPQLKTKAQAPSKPRFKIGKKK